jgi:hypothetical protein
MCLDSKCQICPHKVIEQILSGESVLGGSSVARHHLSLFLGLKKVAYEFLLSRLLPLPTPYGNSLSLGPLKRPLISFAAECYSKSGLWRISSNPAFARPGVSYQVIETIVGFLVPEVNKTVEVWEIHVKLTRP